MLTALATVATRQQIGLLLDDWPDKVGTWDRSGGRKAGIHAIMPQFADFGVVPERCVEGHLAELDSTCWNLPMLGVVGYD